MEGPAMSSRIVIVPDYNLGTAVSSPPVVMTVITIEDDGLGLSGTGCGRDRESECSKGAEGD
jgi:hypothetical protein